MDYIIIFIFLSCFTFCSQIAMVILFAEINKKLKLMDSIEELEAKKELLSTQIVLKECDLKKLEYAYFSKLNEFNTLNTEIGIIKNVNKVGKKK